MKGYLNDNIRRDGTCKWCGKEINGGGYECIRLKHQLTDKQWKERFCECLYIRCLRCGKSLSKNNPEKYFESYCSECKEYWEKH